MVCQFIFSQVCMEIVDCWYEFVLSGFYRGVGEEFVVDDN